jgi:tetratricopeptide (TPR) repeat protein
MVLTKDLKIVRNCLSVLIAVLGLMWLWATNQQHWLKDYIEPIGMVVGSLIVLCQFLMQRWGSEEMVSHTSFNLPDTLQNRTVLNDAKIAIQKAKPEQALRLLAQFKIPKIEESVTLLSARLAKYQRGNLQGIDLNGDNNQAFNRLTADILMLIQALEAEIKTSAAVDLTIKDHLRKRYNLRLGQKLAGRQPVNLRRLTTTEGTSAETFVGFVPYSSDDIRDHIGKIFKDAHGRLLITGVPGAGKTTLLLQLELSLLDSETDKLPVILNLSTWKNEYITLNTWLEEILPTELGVTKKLAADILGQNRLILLFDGFDEIKEKNRETCLDAIAEYGNLGSRQFVITSRIEEYKKVANDAPVYLQIEMGPLTLSQIEIELERLGYEQPEAKPLLYAIGQDELLREAIQIPFYYNTLQLLFASGKKLSNLQFTADTVAGRQAEIAEQFVAHELGLITGKYYTKEHAMHWLSFWAFNLNKNDQVVFELTDLQFNWWRWSKKELMMILLSSFNFFFFFRSALNLNKKVPYISTIDSIKWSWSLYFRRVKKNLKIGLSVGFIMFLFVSLTAIPRKGLEIGLSVGLIFGSLYGLLVSLFSAINLHVFNVGIIQINKPYQRFIASMKVLHFSILQHYLLLYLLSEKNLLPFKLVDFLNDMTNRHILESDGATWRFRHGLLQDYFYESGCFEYTADDYFSKGYHYIVKDDYDEAIEAYKKTIVLLPDEYETFSNLGLAYMGKCAYNQAIEAYKKAIELEPNDHLSLRNLGVAFGSNLEYDQAIDSFQKVIELKPEDYLAFHNLGITYSHKRAYDQAIDSFQKVIELKPDYYSAFYNLVVAYENKGAYDKAIEVFQKIITIEPDDYSVYSSLGFCIIKSGRIDKAEDVLQKAVDFGDLEIGNMNLGHVYLCQGYKEKAIAYYKIGFSHFEDKEEFWTCMKDDLQYLTQYGITEAIYADVLTEIKLLPTFFF